MEGYAQAELAGDVEPSLLQQSQQQRRVVLDLVAATEVRVFVANCVV